MKLQRQRTVWLFLLFALILKFVLTKKYSNSAQNWPIKKFKMHWGFLFFLYANGCFRSVHVLVWMFICLQTLAFLVIYNLFKVQCLYLLCFVCLYLGWQMMEVLTIVWTYSYNSRGLAGGTVFHRHISLPNHCCYLDKIHSFLTLGLNLLLKYSHQALFFCHLVLENF